MVGKLQYHNTPLKLYNNFLYLGGIFAFIQIGQKILTVNKWERELWEESGLTHANTH